MKYIVYTDENNYVTGFGLTDNQEDESLVEVSEEILNSPYFNFYKYENGKFILDEKKKNKVDLRSKIELFKDELSSRDSLYGDWKNLKQLDTGEYTEDEMSEYRAKRQEIRDKINELEKELEDLENE